MAKDSLWKVKPLGLFIETVGGFPVRRGSADVEAIKTALGLLAAGEPVVLFPEGARQSGPIVQPLFDGAVYVAAKAGVPIVPVGVGGSERCMPKGSKLVYPYKIHVIVGDPISPPTIVGRRVDRAELAKSPTSCRPRSRRCSTRPRSAPAFADLRAVSGRRCRRSRR